MTRHAHRSNPGNWLRKEGHTGPDEPGRPKRLKPNDLRIVIRTRGTTAVLPSATRGSNWRKSMVTRMPAQAKKNLESRVECVPRPGRWLFFFDHRTGGIAVVLNRRQQAGRVVNVVNLPPIAHRPFRGGNDMYESI